MAYTLDDTNQHLKNHRKGKEAAAVTDEFPTELIDCKLITITNKNN